MIFLAVQNTFRAGLNAVLPPLCLSCAGLVENTQSFCPACWGGLHFITPPMCRCCGLPFEFAALMPENALCGACMLEAPDFIEARAALTYNKESRELILPFKHHDRTDYAPAFARMLLQAGAGLLEKSEVIVPVPLHPFRLFTRRYNQAAMLALAVGKASGKKVRLAGLIRRRPSESQGRLSRAARKQNVAGAFAVPKRERALLAGRAVLLVDDVLTTGATANACARALLKAGAKEVRVLALARVKKAE